MNKPIWENIPQELAALPHWVCWKYETRPGDPKPTKVPYNARRPRSGAMSNKPETWAPLKVARAAYEVGGFDGVGFMLDLDERIVGVDIDHCINPETGELNEIADRVLAALPTYCEITPSGEGLRLFCLGTLPPKGRKKGNVELYDSVRFLTVTGHAYGDCREVVECDSQLNALHATIFEQPKRQPVQATPRPPLDISDSDLLAKMFSSKSGDKIGALMSGNFQSYFSSQSEADSALCFHLAFWFGRDAGKIDSMFRQSNLMRPKWDESRSSDGRTYGQITIENAIERTSETYNPEALEVPAGGGRAGVGGKKGGFAGFAGEGYKESQEMETGGSVGFVGGGQVVSPEIEVPEFEAPPAPISTRLLPVPRLTAKDIPPSLRDWVSDIAHRMSVPLEYPVAGVLVGLSSLIGRQIAIRPKEFDDWTVIPNLWGMIVGNPGQQKTPTSDESLRPLKRLEAEAAEAHKLRMGDYEVKQDIAKARLKALTADIEKKAKSNAPESELQLLATELFELRKTAEPPMQKRYMVSDATIEALSVVLKENPNGVLLSRDELSAFLKTLDKTGHEADRGFYLEAWNGNGSMTYDRIGRGMGIFIPAICVSVFGTIQPGVLARTVRGASQGEGADGLIQRFQVMMYPDPVPFKHVDRYPDNEAKNKAYELYTKLNNISLSITLLLFNTREAPPASVENEDADSIPYVRFSPEAQQFFNEWWTDLEVTKLRGRESSIIESHLSKYRSLMPSLALIFHLIEVADGAAEGPVSLEAAVFAAGWCDILEAHARRVYQMAFDGDPEPAMRLSERLKASLPNPFTARQVVKKGWSGLATAEDVERAIGVLEDRGWIKTVEVPATPQGGRPSRQHFINPEIEEVQEK
jgi:hypothetical protein